MKKNSILLGYIFIAGLIACQNISFAQRSRIGQGTGAVNGSVVPCSGGAPSITSDEKWARFVIRYDEWSYESIHWTSPSSLLLCNDGTIIFYASHLANMHRTGQIFDEGTDICFYTDLDFYEAQNCTGTPYKSMNIRHTCLSYKRELFQTQYLHGGHEWAPIIRRAGCVNATRTVKDPFTP